MPISRNICVACATPRCPRWRARFELLPNVQFAGHDTLVPEFDRLFKLLTTEQKEFWDEVAKPKASRRAALPKEYQQTTQGLLDNLDKMSGALAGAVNHQDAVIDQLLAIKQIAWLLRNTGGEASLIISKGLAAGKIAPEIRTNYTKFLGGTEIAWNALELTAAGMQLPPALSSAMAATKTAYFEPSYLALRDRLITALIAGDKAEMTANQWSPVTVGRLAAAVGVAEAALDAAREHTVMQQAEARYSLILQLGLLAFAVALTFGAMIAVTRRVIKPLHNMRDAMLKVASGDLTVDTGYTRRQDEIGALAGALETFKQQAVDKLRIEAQERERNAGAAARQQAIEAHVGEFESHGAPDAAATGRRLQPDADHLVRPVGGLAPDQRAGRGRATRFRRGLDERRERRFRLGGTERLDQRYQPAGAARGRASPAARSIRRAIPTAPCRGWRNRRAGSAKWSA